MAASTESLAAKPFAPSWRQKLSSFWQWWSGELSHMAPAWLARMPGMSQGALVALDGDELVLLEGRGGQAVEVVRVPIGSLDLAGKRIALRDLLVRAQEPANSVRIALSHEDVLVRRAKLPLATEENLPQVLAFEMDRLTPFKAADVYFDHRIAHRDVATGKLDIELAVAHRAVVDQRVAALQEMGAAVQGVTLREEAARSGAALDLLPREQRGARDKRDDRLIAWALGAVVFVLLMLALCLPWWQKRQAVIALMPAVERARIDAEGTDKLARDLERQVADYNFLLTRKHGTSTTLEVIEELSRLLPDNTWVQQLDIRTQGKIREVQIAGETPSSSKLIEILEPSRVVQNAAPRGAVTRASQQGNERFLIAGEIRPRALPEPQPVGTLPQPIASPAANPAATAPVAPAAAVPPAATPQAVVPAEPKPAVADVKAVPAAKK